MNSKDSDLINVLLKFGATIDAESFYKGATNGNLTLVQKACEGNVIDVNNKDSKGQSSVYLAAEQGHLLIVEFLVVEKKADVNGTTKEGKIPLWIAANNNKRDVVTFLLAHGSDTITVDEKTFLDAASKGTLAIIEQAAKLIDVNCKNSRGQSALMLAAERGHVEVVEYLILMGADVHQFQDKKNLQTGMNALIAAFRGGKRKDADGKKFTAVIDCLLAHGAKVILDEDNFVRAAALGILALVQQTVEKKEEERSPEVDLNNVNVKALVMYKVEWGAQGIVAAAGAGQLPVVQVSNA